MIEETLAALPAEPVHSFESLGDADARGAAASPASWSTSAPPPDPAPRRAGLLRTSYAGPATLRRVSYVLAFLGFAALIILHEAGHFTAAKAVGMRVERFSLFFGPMLLKSAAARPSTGSARSRSAAT